ncbi:MAG: 50S ribosomal protein L17 [bacterium]|nr:50S ribosomal protein L17 [bacterium]
MRHHVRGRKFNRKKGERQAFIKGLVSNLVIQGKIQTTEARAKELRAKTEKLVTLAKKQNLHALRLLIERIPNKAAATKLYYEVAPRYTTRPGGYTRIKKTAKFRKRDGSRVATIEFV